MAHYSCPSAHRSGCFHKKAMEKWVLHEGFILLWHVCKCAVSWGTPDGADSHRWYVGPHHEWSVQIGSWDIDHQAVLFIFFLFGCQKVFDKSKTQIQQNDASMIEFKFAIQWGDLHIQRLFWSTITNPDWFHESEIGPGPRLWGMNESVKKLH